RRGQGGECIVLSRPRARADPYAADSRYYSVVDAFVHRRKPVVMGPCVRRDDGSRCLMSFNFQRAKHNSAFPRRDSPELCRNDSPRKQRAWGMPGARCTRSRACSVVNTRVSHHGCTGTPGIPARNGFNGFLRALPGDRALLSPSSADMYSANLTPASRRQDHTTSPSASARFVKRAARVHRIPCPTSVTIAKRPSVWDGMARLLKLIWGKREGKYFCK